MATSHSGMGTALRRADRIIAASPPVSATGFRLSDAGQRVGRPNSQWKSNSVALACLIGALWSSPPSAAAAWAVGGVPICQLPSCAGIYPQACPDGAGGAFVAWHGGVAPFASLDDVYVHHVLPTGQLDPSWPSNGVALCTAPGTQIPKAVIPDGLGGAIVVWEDRRNSSVNADDVYIGRVTAQGMPAPSWPVNGAAVCTTSRSQVTPKMVSDGAGGAFVTWHDTRSGFQDVYAIRMTGEGTIAAGWPINGQPVSTFPNSRSISQAQVADGEGGLYLAWGETRNGDVNIYGTRLNGDGTRRPGWTEEGNLLVGGPLNQLAPEAVADGEGGVYLGWFNSTGSVHTKDLYAIRLDADGIPRPGWPSGGVPVCTAPFDQEGLRLAAHSSGLFLGWHDSRGFNSDIYAQVRTPDGAIAPGWVVDGVLVADRYQFEFMHSLVANGNGGAYLAFEHNETPRRIYIQHMGANGLPAPGWPPQGVRVADTPGQQDGAQLVSDGAGGAIVVWHDQRTGGTGIYTQKYVPDGPVSTTISLASASAEPDRVHLVWLGAGVAALEARVERRSELDSWETIGTPSADGSDRLSFEDRTVIAGGRYAYRLQYRDAGESRVTAEHWIDVPARFELALYGLQPNPARRVMRVAFSLPDDRPARLEAFDVTGRRVAAHDLGDLGPGRHSLAIGDRGSLAPGIYVVRLTHAERSLIQRGVVIR